jgi:hypothetical protein
MILKHWRSAQISNTMLLVSFPKEIIQQKLIRNTIFELFGVQDPAPWLDGAGLTEELLWYGVWLFASWDKA